MADITPNINQSPAMLVAANRIEGFARQFEESHRKLALHAAFPLVLTPDLLYQIWVNFVPEAPWVAVANVLLSRLCREVGYEMYEMDIAIRNLLLKELKEKYGQQQLNELGDFLLHYVEQRLKNDDPHTQDLKRTQEWTALVYTKPGTATRELAEALSAKVKQEDMAEGFHLTSLIETWAEPLAEAGFGPLLVYADGIRSFFGGDEESAATKLSKLPGGWDNAQIAGVSLSIPEQIKSILPEPKTSPENEKPKLYALLIGAELYLPNRLSDGVSYKSLRGCVNDVNLVEKFLQSQLGLPEECIFKLTSSHPDRESLELGESPKPMEPERQWPTYKNIVTAFQHLEDIAQPGDRVYIHYSGHGGRVSTIYPKIKGESGDDISLVPIDVGSGEGQYLRDLELVTLLAKMLDKGLVLTVVLDCSHSGGFGQSMNSHYMNSHYTNIKSINYVLLAACRPSELAYEQAPVNEERNGALTYWFVDSAINMGTNITYKQLYNRIFAKVQSKFPQQTPMLWGQGDRVVFGNDYRQTENGVTVMQVEVEENTTKVKLNAGQAQGVRKGVKFAIYPLSLTSLRDTKKRLALVEITELEASHSWAEVTTILDSESVIEQGAQAVMTSAPDKLVRKVRLLKDKELPLKRNAALQAVEVTLTDNDWLELAGSEEVADYQLDVKKITSATEAERYQVAVEEVIYEIYDRTGAPIILRPVLKVSDSNCAKGVVQRLVHLAKYQGVLELENHDASSPLRGQVVMELLGKQKDYDPVDFPEPEPEAFADPNYPEVEAGEYLLLKIRNNYSRPINLAILNLESNWAINLIYPLSGEFISLEPSQEEFIPLRMSLAEGEEEGEDILKVFATIESANFSWLELPPLDKPILNRDTSNT